MKKGFTLLEIVIAMAIASIALTAIANNFISGMRAFNTSVQQSDDISTISSYLQNYLDNPTAAGSTTNDDGDQVIFESSPVNVTIDLNSNGTVDQTIQMKEIKSEEDGLSVSYYEKN